MADLTSGDGQGAAYHIGDQIKRARIAAGLTQEKTVSALADLGFSLTKAGLSKYERGGSVPKATLLRALGAALGVPASYFIEDNTASPSVEWLAFRKTSRLGKKSQEQVRILAEVHIEIFFRLRAALTIAWQPSKTDSFRVDTPEDAELAAEALRKRWKLGVTPIGSVTGAIEDAGGVVVELETEVGFDGLSGWAEGRTPVVVLNATMPDDRRRFNLAHELGHLYMEVGGTTEKEEERLAHRFAAAFLVPAAVVRRELGASRRHLDFRELALLKEKYGLSMQAWIYRAKDLDVIDEAHARTLFMRFSANGWRKKEPVDYRAQERPLQLQQMTVRALAEGLITHRDAQRIWPSLPVDVSELSDRPAGALDPRTLMRLPQKERNRLLDQAAARIGHAYESGELSELELLSEEDEV